MFVDITKIYIKAGNGGNGKVSFHREKYIASGGPDGGDGGRGGNVVFVADDNLSTLADFRYRRKYIAENGGDGGAARCSGKKAEDLVLRVPRGTLVKDAATGRLMADISDDEPVIIAKGGNGGWGNCHFATPTRQTPRFANPGNPGEEFEVNLELKLLADVGLIGFPNVGKSTFISVVSEAKPKIANYHFTTLTPVLGVVRKGEKSFVMADIPGLIEGAGSGVGLGHEFLRHIERCRLLVHIIDASGSEGRDPIEDFNAINRELAEFDADLAQREQIVVANKCDMCEPEQLEKLKEYFVEKGYDFFPCMAAIAEGTDKVVDRIAERLSKLPPVKRYEADPVPEEELMPKNNREFTLHKEGDRFVVEGEWLLKLLNSVNPDDYESLQYFQRTLQSSGIIDALVKAGVQDGDTVCVYDIEFDYIS